MIGLATSYPPLATRRMKIRRPLLIPRDDQLAANFIEFIHQTEHRSGRPLNRCDYRIKHEINRIVMKPGFKFSQSSFYIILVT